MGRPLKINKAAQTGSTTLTGGIDIGFNGFNTLTDPVYPAGDTYFAANPTAFLGVVGGSNTVDTVTYPTVKVRVFITGFSDEDGYIIRQKGSRKYLVGGTTARTALVSGLAYRITTVGDTAWNSYGVQGTAAVGTIFTATAALGNTGTGRVNAVGICVLYNNATPTAGNMSIAYAANNDSTEVYLSKLTNKFLLNFIGGQTGGAANTGEVWNQTQVLQDTRYATNFFTDEDATVIKSGTTGGANVSGQQNLVELAQVQNYNS